MDNFNALSKSAILTKLALDGYFIDLLTLNSFIKEWQIEAIYENEFGIEFFDNNSYLTILDKLKERYNRAKKGLEEKPAAPFEKKPATASVPEPAAPPASNISSDIQEEIVVQAVSEPPENEIQIEENITKESEITKTQITEEKPAEKKEADAVSLEELANESKNNTLEAAENSNQTDASQPEEEIEFVDEFEDTIMPLAMKNLKPGPVSPNSNIVVDHSYIPKKAPLTPEIVPRESIQSESSLDDLIVEENFSQDEIEKANELMSKAAQKPLPESITETYFEPKAAKTQPPAPKEEAPVQNQDTPKDTKETKQDELDLVQLAQSFAQNFTGGDMKDVPPADLEQIFTESYTDSFSELQDYVKEDEPEEYQSLQEDLPSDIIAPEIPKEATHFDSALSSNTSSLNADDVRNIIREEITRQTASIIPVPQNNENVREIVREIVKQTADVVPQNAFKLDISQGTLDMIAKTIAKKIAIKLNSYYKLNSSKQNAKLQLFRQRTIELKERNQMLADENRKLKARLLETNRDLECYRPAAFGLFKYVGKKRR